MALQNLCVMHLNYTSSAVTPGRLTGRAVCNPVCHQIHYRSSSANYAVISFNAVHCPPSYTEMLADL